MKRLLIVAATPFEIAPLQAYINEHFEQKSALVFQREKLEIHLLVTGIGMTHTAYAMGRYLGARRPDLAINLGIAGAFKRELGLGEVVHVVQERFGDLGVELGDGQFQDLFEADLWQANGFPFQAGTLRNQAATDATFLPKATAISVQKVHGYPPSIDAIQQKYQPDIESMEGAAFFYVCLQEKIPFLEIRAISNYVEARNKANWDIPLAIEALNKVAIAMIQDL